MHLSMLHTKRRNAHLVTAFVLVVSLLSFKRQHAVECLRFPDGRNLLFSNGRKTNHLTSRRCAIAIVTQLVPMILLDPRKNEEQANALSLPSFDQQQDRRQKELCLVNLLRLQLWAGSVSDKLQSLDLSEEESRKKLYLEARLGSKVMVAESKKISGGATASVFMLKGLHIRECLDDLAYYADRSSKRKMNQYREDLIESIASIVEFDGLETTQDDSPRSSLTLTMYNSQKSIYVQRMLGERVVPLTEDIIRIFGPDARAQSEYYVKEFYPSEIAKEQEREEIKSSD